MGKTIGTDSSFGVFTADAVDMNFVDLAPTSPLIVAELAAAVGSRLAPDPTRAVTRVILDDRPTERSIKPPDRVGLGESLDTYL